MAARRRNTRERNENTQNDTNISQRPPKKKKNKKSWLRKAVSPQVWQAAAILIIAMLTSLVWNHLDPVDPQTKAFLRKFCQTSYCHDALVPSRRTQKTIRRIPPSQTLVEIPREVQIWDLDALRDDFVRQELAKARIDNRPLAAAAFLAAHLGRLQKKAKDKNGTSIDNNLLDEYLQLLPSYEDFAFHPTQWPDQELKDLLGHHTLTYAMVRAFQHSIESEYTALVQASKQFRSEITRQDYVAARLSVMTRSFGTGPIPLNEARHESIQDELNFYKSTFGVDLSRGCHAMVPVLDFYDHHARPNVQFSYNDQKRAFVVQTLVSIEPDSEVVDTYGRHSDPHLFAKYGFVNGDGSEYTQTSLALWHKMGLDPEQTAQDVFKDPRHRFQVLPYLQYDDGYDECVDIRQAEAWELKILKYQHLYQISNAPTHWTVTMPPRNPESLPATASNRPITIKPPKFNPQELHFDGSMIFSTCKLISLTHNDYNGQAIEVLRANLRNASFVVEADDDALEFRTLMCIARMASTALARMETTVEQQLEQVFRLNKDAFQSKQWHAAHARLGEMQTLDALKGVALRGLHHRFADKMESKETAYRIRNDPCPREYLEPLLKYVAVE